MWGFAGARRKGKLMASADSLSPSVQSGSAVSLPGEGYFVREGDWQDPSGLLSGPGGERSRQTVEVARVSRYPIVIGRGALDDWVGSFEQLFFERGAVWIVADTTAWELYGDRMLAAPGASALVRDILTLDVSERVK